MKRVALAAFVLLGLALAFQTWRLGLADAREFAAWVEHQRAELTAAGLERAVHASQKELAKVVPALRDALAAAEAAGARSIIATHFEGKADAIHVPGVVSPQAPPGRGSVLPHEPAPPGAPGGAALPGIDVDPWVRFDEAIVVNDAGEIYVKRAVDVQLQVGTWFSGWRPVKPTKLEAPTKTAVDPQLEKALAAWRAPKPPRIAFLPRPLKQWRAGWSCGPGGGATLAGTPAAGLFCVWGPQL